MSYQIPHQYEPEIQHIAESAHISRDEAFERVIRAGLERLTIRDEQPRVSLESLFGAAKGPGTRKTREEVDRYIAELRAEW